jgi:polar amino acid transport system substrate-binding protein
MLAGCGSGGGASANTAKSNPYHLTTPGKLVAATSGDQPPVAFHGKNGKPTGFIIDITNKVAKKLQLQVTYKLTQVPSGIQGLTSGRYDMVANGLGVTAKRKKSIAFAKGLYWSNTAILTKKTSPIHSMHDLAGKKIGVVTGSVQVDYLKKYPKAIATTFNGQNSAVSALNSGSIDGFMLGGPEAKQYIDEFSKLHVAASQPVDHATTVAFQKGNTALVKAFNKQVKAMIANGTYMRLYKRYFAQPPAPQLKHIWPGIAS